MELFGPEFWSALLAIILIDLVLAGDNAIVIALAARNLPPEMQRKAILWGTFGAIAVRVLITMVVVWLLKIPGLMLLGGLGLLWIAVKLGAPAQPGGGAHVTPAATTFFGAMKTIVVADALMGLDNVLAVAGAAHGSMLLVVLGLLISIPIVIWGSTFVLKALERFPSIVYIGTAVLALTAVKMIMGEPMISEWFEGRTMLVWAAYGLGLAVVLSTTLALQRRNELALIPVPQKK